MPQELLPPMGWKGSEMGSRLTDLNRWPLQGHLLEIHCAPGDLGCFFDSKVNRFINRLLNLLCLMGISLWALFCSLRASQVALSKAGLLANGVVDCALANMSA